MALLAEKGLRKLFRGIEISSTATLALRGVTLAVTLFAWVPFRSPSIEHAFSYWSSTLWGAHHFDLVAGAASGLFYAALYLIHLWTTRLTDSDRTQQPAALAYLSLLLVMPGKPVDFIYFQF